MSLQQWLDNSWISSVKPSAQVISDLSAIANREIADASLEGISPDGRFNHAYNAVRSLCEAALCATGYAVPRGGRKHERVLESLKFTLGGQWADDVDFLDRCRRWRHQTIYERPGVVQKQDADDLLEVAIKLNTQVREWLQNHHADLI